MAMKMKLVPEDWMEKFKSPSPPHEATVSKPLASENVTKKAKILQAHIGLGVQTDDNNCVVYDDDTVGSNYDVLLRYVTDAKSSRSERPMDSDRFLQLLVNLQVPDNLVDKRFQQLFAGSSINTGKSSDFDHHFPASWTAY